MQRTGKRGLVTAALTVLVLVTGLVAALTRHEPGPTRYLTDDQGRALFLHGLNTSGSAKGDPDRLPWITEDDVQAEYDAMGTWGPWDARAEGDELTPGPLAHVMNRAYPRAVAGQPLELGPDDASGALSVRYAENGASGATELYLPEDVFGEEFDLTVDTPAGDDGWTSRWDGGRRVLHVTVTGAADGDETVLTVAPT
ncbi:hypothetical protein [Nocardiopsis prasina]|uniref:hypothetical protein n=1 Tax=Nocardiopsis prasina TaxID=2015 RepID=UPI000345C9C2|nr:hypothetical protein [Nocardiopsis prasina]